MAYRESSASRSSIARFKGPCSFQRVRENSFPATSVHRRPIISSRIAAEFISPARKRWEKWESGASPAGATPVLCVLKELGLSRAE